MPKLEKTPLILGALFLGLFVLGYVFPEPLWATHFPAFAGWLGYATLAGAVALLILGTLPAVARRLDAGGGSRWTKWLWPVLLAAMGTVVFVLCPIAVDIYGDAGQWKEDYSAKFFPAAELWKNILNPNVFDGRSGVMTVLPAVCLLRQAAGITFADAFRWTGAVCGFLFLVSNLLFLRWYVPHRRWGIALATLIVSSPILLNFAGHIEAYAPVLVVVSWFVMAQLAYLKSHRPWHLVLAIVLLLLAVKLHVTSTLLVPSLGLTMLHALWGRHRPTWSARVRWRSLLTWILPPIFAVGAFVYFVVLEDHIDPRFQSRDLIHERMFLPMFSPEPPLDRYNVFGGNHILDYANLLLTWSPGGVLLLAIACLGMRRRIDWNAAPVVLLGLTLILYAAFFFMMNPFLSMPMDFDLFCIPAPVLILFLAALAGAAKTEDLSATAVGGVLALGLMIVPFFAVNAKRPWLSQRLEVVGIHIFKTYWMHSSDVIVESHKMVTAPRSEAATARLQPVLDALEPYAVPGKDQIFGYLATRMARHYQAIGQPARARNYYEKSLYFQKNAPDSLAQIFEIHFMLANYAAAHDVALQLVERGEPDPLRAAQMALASALEAGRYKQAVTHCQQYLRVRPQDALVQRTLRDLQAGRNLDQLKLRFRAGTPR